MTVKRKLFLAGGMTLGVVVGFVLTMVFLSHFQRTEKILCTRCHIMREEVRGWRQGTHVRVSCIKCHFRPGVLGYMGGVLFGAQFLWEALTEPTPTHVSHGVTVANESCLRCHEKDMGKAMDFEGKIFDHRGLLERRYQCTQCHSDVGMGHALPPHRVTKPFLPFDYLVNEAMPKRE